MEFTLYGKWSSEVSLWEECGYAAGVTEKYHVKEVLKEVHNGITGGYLGLNKTAKVRNIRQLVLDQQL